MVFRGLALALLAPGCAQVKPHLTLPEMAVEDRRFVATLEALTGAPATDERMGQPPRFTFEHHDPRPTAEFLARVC
jgi:hypothetical protein